jgi:hypothetical protein
MIKKHIRAYGAFYNSIANGQLTAFQLVIKDDLRIGDLVLFQEYKNNGGYTGREVLAKVTYSYINQNPSNGAINLFCFKLVNPKTAKLDGQALELASQLEQAQQFRLFVRKRLTEVASTAQFSTRVELEKLLTAFDKKIEHESIGKGVKNG